MSEFFETDDEVYDGMKKSVKAFIIIRIVISF